MREHRMTIGHRDRAPYATWAARIIGATCIFLPLLLVLSWSITAEQDGDRLTHKLGVACSDMVARMRQTNGGDFTQHWPVAHPECWPARAKTRSAAVGN